MKIFLLGGDINLLGEVAEDFIIAAGGQDASITILLSGENGWKEHIKEYTIPFQNQGLSNLAIITPDNSGSLETEESISLLEKSDGIIIGGGNTIRYQKLFTSDLILEAIQALYHSDVPIIGLSSGALILPKFCVVPPQDSDNGKSVVLEGLGLIKDKILGVHFTKWNALPYTLDAMIATKTPSGLGIDSSACALIENGKYKRSYGQSVYQIQLSVLDDNGYELTTAA